ncbi:unnamed protein product [Adineta ricciae]|uniref:N-acetylglucosaminylphosphatidylinositol deacetylase n=1 Tax=Adineta ricciae TaxID=249248 RepID=A0A814PUL3_ADIRI|nr:unnamed protein product [Adineta ricciae]CAF1592001.1 unnamed protein product [Adineta ricciae]
MFFILLLIFLICLLLILVPFLLIRLISSTSTENYGNCLLVIAHPDDECMFFSPTLLSLRSDFYVLCLSNGNNHRSDELRRSCLQLRVKDLKIIDDQIYLKDSQSVDWSSDAILGHVKQSIRQWNISTIISFDQYGVSGHRNHSSLYYALVKLSPTDQIRFFALQSYPIYRKYLTLVEFLRVRFSSKPTGITIFILPGKDCFTPYKAMFEHRSQLVWFRYLYLLFSQYLWINNLKRVY